MGGTDFPKGFGGGCTDIFIRVVQGLDEGGDRRSGGGQAYAAEGFSGIATHEVVLVLPEPDDEGWDRRGGGGADPTEGKDDL
jgi:hypothetical protein